MSFYPDLSICEEFDVSEPEKLIAVGWLDREHDYHRASVSPEVVSALFELLRDPWQPAVFMGKHDCSFCVHSGGPATFQRREQNDNIELGVNNLFVPGLRCVYICPSLIIHYIDAHQYCPPGEFLEAVLNCRPMRTIHYLKAIKENGPRWQK